MQIYNYSLCVPTTMTIVGKSGTMDFETNDGNRGLHLDSYTRALNSTGKYPAYYARYVGGFSFERYRPILCSQCALTHDGLVYRQHWTGWLHRVITTNLY